MRGSNIPFLLFDCLGLVTPTVSLVFERSGDAFSFDFCGRFLTFLGGGLGGVTGAGDVLRKTEGDGIWIFSSAMNPFVHCSRCAQSHVELVQIRRSRPQSPGRKRSSCALLLRHAER